MSKNTKTKLEGLAALADLNLDLSLDPSFISVLAEMKADPEWQAIEQIGQLEKELSAIEDVVAERRAMQAKLPDLQKVVANGLDAAKRAIKKSVEMTSKRAGTMKMFQEYIAKKAEAYCLTQPEWVKAKGELKAVLAELENTVGVVDQKASIEWKITDIMKNLAKEAK